MPEIIIDYSPRTYMVPYHDRAQRFACLVAHRRAGKTVGSIHDKQKRALLNTSQRPRYAYIAPLLKQAKAVAWDILKAAASPLIPYGAEINESELRVDYPNGAQIRLYGGDNPDALRGIYLDGVTLDEPAQMDPRLFPEIIRPALSDRRGYATFIGTPKGRDYFYQVWTNALSDPEWFTMRLRASETGVIPHDELEAARRIMSESQYAREFECSFDEPDVDQFIPSSMVDAAVDRKSRPLGPKVLGLDVARHGDDRTVALFRNGDVIESDWIKVWRGLDTMQTVGRVAELITLWAPDQVFVDGVGVGGGVVDRLRQLGYRVTDVNGGSTPMNDERYYNLRAEMWAKMKEWLAARGDIPNNMALANDLSAPSYSFDARNRLKLEKKEEMKSRGLPSPDLADALALTFARPVATPDVQPYSVKWGNKRAQYVEDWNPLDGF